MTFVFENSHSMYAPGYASGNRTDDGILRTHLDSTDLLQLLKQSADSNYNDLFMRRDSNTSSKTDDSDTTLVDELDSIPTSIQSMLHQLDKCISNLNQSQNLNCKVKEDGKGKILKFRNPNRHVSNRYHSIIQHSGYMSMLHTSNQAFTTRKEWKKSTFTILNDTLLKFKPKSTNPYKKVITLQSTTSITRCTEFSELQHVFKVCNLNEKSIYFHLDSAVAFQQWFIALQSVIDKRKSFERSIPLPLPNLDSNSTSKVIYKGNNLNQTLQNDSITSVGWDSNLDKVKNLDLLDPPTKGRVRAKTFSVIHTFKSNFNLAKVGFTN